MINKKQATGFVMMGILILFSLNMLILISIGINPFERFVDSPNMNYIDWGVKGVIGIFVLVAIMLMTSHNAPKEKQE